MQAHRAARGNLYRAVMDEAADAALEYEQEAHREASNMLGWIADRLESIYDARQPTLELWRDTPFGDFKAATLDTLRPAHMRATHEKGGGGALRMLLPAELHQTIDGARDMLRLRQAQLLEWQPTRAEIVERLIQAEQREN